LALKFNVLIGFHGFILASFHLELIVIQSFSTVAGSGTTVVPVEVFTGFTGSGSSTASSMISSDPL